MSRFVFLSFLLFVICAAELCPSPYGILAEDSPHTKGDPTSAGYAAAQETTVSKEHAEKTAKNDIAGAPDVSGETLPQSVRSTDLLTKIPIIGVLGHPWGETITIRAYVHVTDDGKSRWYKIRVTSVNGKALNVPVDFLIGSVQPLFGAENTEKWNPEEMMELKGYEEGKIQDFPTEALNVMNSRSTVGYDYIKYGFRFVPRFQYFESKRVGAQNVDVPKNKGMK